MHGYTIQDVFSMVFNQIKLLFPLLALVFCNCYYTMGLFRNARTLETNHYEISSTGGCNLVDALGTLRLRYGLFKYADVEITGLGAIGLIEHGNYYGFGYSTTFQLPFFDYMAIGFQGGYSNFRNGIGPRLIFGKSWYIGFEENYLFATKDKWGDEVNAQYTENIFIGIQANKAICFEYVVSNCSSLGGSVFLGAKWSFLTN